MRSVPKPPDGWKPLCDPLALTYSGTRASVLKRVLDWNRIKLDVEAKIDLLQSPADEEDIDDRVYTVADDVRPVGDPYQKATATLTIWYKPKS